MEKRPFAQKSTRLFKSESNNGMRQFVQFIKEGKLVVMPTDTVYGIGCNAFDEQAIAQLYQVKQRTYDKAIPILLAEVNQLPKIVAEVPDHARDLIRRFWPGPLTIILPKKSNLPANLSPNENIAVRIPDHALTRSIIRLSGGAMAVTSANLSGQAAAINGDEAMRYFDGLIAAVFDDGVSPQQMASTIVDCSGEKVTVLREGPISAQELAID